MHAHASRCRIVRTITIHVNAMFTDQADRLSTLLARITPRLAAIPEKNASTRPAPGKWSAKEILGHLVDSASNNHQRFVRGATDNPYEGPGYPQDHMVVMGAWQDTPWQDVVTLWSLYNKTLCRVIGRIPEPSAAHECRVGTYAPVTLHDLVVDYSDHIEHHLPQIWKATGG